MVCLQRPVHFLEGKTIVVVGAGIAGAAFVVGLQKLWNSELKPPKLLIFDRDRCDDNFRRLQEGYNLSLTGHDDKSGLRALQKLGLLDEVLSRAVLAGSHGQGFFKIWGPDWREKFCLRRYPRPGLPTSSIRVKQELRRVLADAIETRGPWRIQWDSQCVRVKRKDDNRLQVCIQRGVGNGSSSIYDCDFIVAADGAHSKIRSSLRPKDGLLYTGAVLRGGLSRFEGSLPPPVSRDWGFIMSGTGVSCFFSPVDSMTVFWAVGNFERDPIVKVNDSAGHEAEAIVARARELGLDFQEPFATIVSRTDLNTVICINAEDKMPLRHDHLAVDPIIFIGESNHALSPFAGYGANLALADGWDLAEQLCGRATLEEAVATFDSISEPRAYEILRRARRNMLTGHSRGWRCRVVWIMLRFANLIGWMSFTIRSLFSSKYGNGF